MPFARCPTCDQRFHLNVSNVEEWYRERWPSLPIGSEVPEMCPACWGKRSGVPLPWAERLRPYAREELSTIGDSKPDRGRVCPGCGEVLPRFADLTPDTEMQIRRLSLEGRKMMATQELLVATGCPLAWANLWVAHPTGPDLHDKTGPGPDCYYCGKALRSSLACQCVECGMDWHDVRCVMRLGGAGSPGASDEAPPEAIGLVRVTAWAHIESVVKPRGRTRHLNVEGPLPTANALAIAKSPESGGWYVFHCDSTWNVIADTWHASLAEAQAQAAFEFEGIGTRWRYRLPP